METHTSDVEALRRELQTLGAQIAIADPDDPELAVLTFRRDWLTRKMALTLVSAPQAQPLTHRIAAALLAAPQLGESSIPIAVRPAEAQVLVEAHEGTGAIPVAAIDVGEHNQIGELQIGNVAGRDVITVNVYVTGGPS